MRSNCALEEGRREERERENKKKRRGRGEKEEERKRRKRKERKEGIGSVARSIGRKRKALSCAPKSQEGFESASLAFYVYARAHKVRES